MQERYYGDYDIIPDELSPEAHIEISVTPIDLRAHWQRCGQLSDLVAEYIACAYPEIGKPHQSPIFSSISTIFQELIENAAKFSRQREAVIRIRVKHYDRVLRIEVQNDTTLTSGQRFEEYIQKLLATTDLEALHIQTVEGRAPDDKQSSGIGLLLLLKDYGVKLGVRFMRDGNERDIIIVRVHYRLEDIF